ncbi:hypothetical protein CANCADRAFT_102862 [Tortispora caseinolytica NRRL Y-17796]|uniref:Integral membrane protein n=1 Tax=Tortispora caseinolytica NRRL Y-17796 TaxID=767744 RepID=A0A1E4TEK3_9ASCO|nr:hypothetical protein CANCADRAFT_102862 [Tortispora caseinolytica NRRL Y-17796]
MDATYFLYYTKDIWLFTVYWTMILFAAFHTAASCYAAYCLKNFKWGLVLIATYLVVSIVEAFFSGSVIGFMLAAVYNTGSFPMSTWIPLVWAVIQVLFVVATSYQNMATIL